MRRDTKTVVLIGSNSWLEIAIIVTIIAISSHELLSYSWKIDNRNMTLFDGTSYLESGTDHHKGSRNCHQNQNGAIQRQCGDDLYNKQSSTVEICDWEGDATMIYNDLGPQRWWKQLGWSSPPEDHSYLSYLRAISHSELSVSDLHPANPLRFRHHEGSTWSKVES